MKILLVAAVLVFLAACHKPKPAAAEASTPSAQEKFAERAAAAPASTQKRWDFLNRLRQEDAFNRVIHRTLLNDQEQLGVDLYANVAPEKVPELMRAVMARMAEKFPDEDVALAVYAVATPPKRIGTARVDGKTGETSFTPSP